jgi:hypothetical protein
MQTAWHLLNTRRLLRCHYRTAVLARK